MNPSYRLGLLIVLGTVTVSMAATTGLEMFGPRKDPIRAGADFGETPYPLGSFRLNERSGKAVTEADLSGDVWVAGFIFTRCPSSCPRITSVMKGLQGPFRKAGVKLVSLTVDPKHDTPEVLRAFATGYGADPSAWWFLTGPKEELYPLILERFHISVAETPGEDRKPGIEDISHSPLLALVDKGNQVVGVFDSNDADQVRDLLKRATRKASWARPLPALNAMLNGTCAGLLIVGWLLILNRWVKAHAVAMIAAVLVSAVFLACYLAYHFEVGSVSFRGVGGRRAIYLGILLSHTLLATFGVVPLVGLTLYRAVRGEFARHAWVARITFPIWLYVSVTGVVIYWMLYVMPVSSSSAIGP